MRGSLPGGDETFGTVIKFDLNGSTIVITGINILSRFFVSLAVLRGQELLEGTKSKVWGHLHEGKCHI